MIERQLFFTLALVEFRMSLSIEKYLSTYTFVDEIQPLWTQFTLLGYYFTHTHALDIVTQQITLCV
jgi:hypothetical protein